MPKASKETASEHETLEGYEGHFEHFEDGWTVGFETYTQDADLPPFFKGLPNDECQCEHMGYVIKGKVAFRSGDDEEVFEGGDAYYVGQGHTPILYAGTEVVEFSPTEELGPDHGGRDQEHGGNGGVLLSACPERPQGSQPQPGIQLRRLGQDGGRDRAPPWSPHQSQVRSRSRTTSSRTAPGMTRSPGVRWPCRTRFSHCSITRCPSASTMSKTNENLPPGGLPPSKICGVKRRS
jgi:hypothetical protein